MMVRTKIFVKEDTKMLYTEKEKHEIERVKEVFAEHLRQSPDFELLWSDKVGYVWLTIGVNPVYVVTQLLLHLLQRKKPLKSLKKKLTMQKPDQKPLPRHRKLIPKNPIRLQKKFKKELFLQLIIFCIKPKPGRIFHSYRVFHCHFFSKTVD